MTYFSTSKEDAIRMLDAAYNEAKERIERGASIGTEINNFTADHELIINMVIDYSETPKQGYHLT